MKVVAGFLVPESDRDPVVCGRCERDMDPKHGYPGGAGIVRVRDRRGGWCATYVCEWCYAELRRSA